MSAGLSRGASASSNAGRRERAILDESRQHHKVADIHYTELHPLVTTSLGFTGMV